MTSTIRLLIIILIATLLPAQTISQEDGALPGLAAFDIDADGRITFVWSTYLEDREWMHTRSVQNGQPGPATELSPGAGLYSQNRFVATGPNSGYAVWTRHRDGRFEIVGRMLHEGSWAPLETLSAPGTDSIAPAVAFTGFGLIVAWEEHADDQRIVHRVLGSGGWSPAARITPLGMTPTRPAVVAAGSAEAWIVWDAYLERETNYAVFARRVGPSISETERISPPETNALKPAAGFLPGPGLAVAWVKADEVIGGAGVLDHRDTIQLAVRTDGLWQPTLDNESVDIARLEHSLLARMEPEFEAVWGFTGDRRKPMLLVADGDLWLLWERKVTAGGRSYEPGQLCARSWNGKRWSKPVILHEGLAQYRIPGSGTAPKRSLIVAGRDPEHNLIAATVNLNKGKRFSFEPWPGWKTVKLPQDEPARRHRIKLGDQTLNLYWADLHVHTELTVDAEGEPDELAHFARDKALIDVVVLQENDSNSWATKAYVDHRLTASDYSLSIFLSRRHSKPGRFLAIPGWEWSQRTADDDKPNHRTVMFAGSDAPLVRHTENDNNFDELCQLVQTAGGNMFTQHDEFRLSGCPADTNVEVATGWGNYFDPPDRIHQALDNGHRVGFVATSDGHRRNPGTGGGLTGIYAPELTYDAILDALKHRRNFATNGSKIILDARANGHFMGEQLTATGQVGLTIRAAAPEPILRAVLVRNGTEIHTVTGDSELTLGASFTDTPPPSSSSYWYYWRIELEGEQIHYGGNVESARGRYAWSSPHWVLMKQAP
jgi:uncharacterized protein DUF3604